MLDENKLLFDELYEKTRNFGRVQFVKLLMAKEREIKELKKQLEEIKNEPLTNRIGRIDSVIANIYSRNRTHKKKFIEYLENEIKNSDICDVYVRGMKFNSAEKMIYKDILSKYKEIIGVKDE